VDLLQILIMITQFINVTGYRYDTVSLIPRRINWNFSLCRYIQNSFVIRPTSSVSFPSINTKFTSTAPICLQGNVLRHRDKCTIQVLICQQFTFCCHHVLRVLYSTTFWVFKESWMQQYLAKRLLSFLKYSETLLRLFENSKKILLLKWEIS
jgi:hypothetical protein